MRDDYLAIQQSDAAVLCVAPHTLAECQRLVKEHTLPFPVLADPDREVFTRYDVKSSIWSLGQRPATFLIDSKRTIRWAYRGTQQWEIPTKRDLFQALDAVNSDRPAVESDNREG